MEEKYLRYIYAGELCYGLIEDELIYQIETDFLLNKPVKTGKILELNKVKILI